MTDDNLESQPAALAGPESSELPPADAGETAAPGAEPKDVALLARVLEALVFVHRGTLTPKTVREVLGEEFAVDEIAAGFAALREEYERRGGAIVLLEFAGGYQLGTREDLAPWIRKLDFYEHHRHLSRPTLETLAIIAYRQPVTRAEIEAIRGVSVERIVRTLIERKLVRILGHKDVPGRPMVLGTTKEFLELFGLNSLAGLPPLKDFVEPPSEEGIDEELPLPRSTEVDVARESQAGLEPAGAGDGTEREGGDDRERDEAGWRPPLPGADAGDEADNGADPGVEPPEEG